MLCIRGDMLARCPAAASPEIYGARVESGHMTPRQRIAAAIEAHWGQYGSRPSPEALEQAVLVERRRLGPAEGEVLERELGNVLATPEPDDPAWAFDQARAWAEARRFENGIIRAADDLTAGGPSAVAAVRKILAEVLATAPGGALSWQTYDAAEAWGFPPVEFAVEALLPARGVVWLGGRPKQGKSLFMLYASLAIACGRETVAGRFAVLRRPTILYVSAEDPGSRLQSRVEDILSAWGGATPEPGALTFLIKPAGLDLGDPAAVEALRAKCAELGATMLVLDTWTRLSPTADPMGAEDQLAIVRNVVALAEDIGLVVVVDHSRKNRPDGQPLSSADILGPSQKWQAAEHTIMLENVEGQEHQRVQAFAEGKDGETARFLLEVSDRGSKTEKFTYGGSPDGMARSQREVGESNRESVHQAIAGAGQAGAGIGDVVAALQAKGVTLRDRTVRLHAATLIAAGRVTKTGATNTLRYYATELRQGAP